MPPTTSRLLIPLGWVLSAASLLNLIQDLSEHSIKSKLADWLAIYDRYVKAAGEVAFGWIDWRWISITDSELHVFVLGTISVSYTHLTLPTILLV